jgi:hypothetical protein
VAQVSPEHHPRVQGRPRRDDVITVAQMDNGDWAVGLVRAGRAWDQNTALGQQQLLAEHRAYLGRLVEAGEVTQAGSVIGPGQGPAADGLVGLVIYAVAAERAATLAQDHPAVRSGLIALDIRPWYTVA